MNKPIDQPDDDNPEWTEETTARAVGADGLPESLQRKLRRPQEPAASGSFAITLISKSKPASQVTPTAVTVG
ncbi:hypothetical protein BOSP111201_14050 [Bordetella sputigena]